MSDCFDHIIGFTELESECFTSKDAEKLYKKSNSGLYMDGLEESKHLSTAIKNTTCCDDLYGSFYNARRNAITSFKEKLFQELGTRFTIRQAPFSGLIGQKAFSGPYATASTFVGAVYEMRNFKGGLLIINKIFVAINETRQVSVSLYKAYLISGEYQLQGEALKTIVVDAVANTSTEKKLDDPIELPLTDDSSHIIHYLLLVDRSAGFLPMDNDASCGCANQQFVDRWLLQGGIEGMDKEHLRAVNRKTGKGSPIYGIVVEANLSCADLSFVCQAYGANPFIRTAMNHAVLYQAVSNVLASILRTDDVSRFALTKRDQMSTDSVILHNKFKSRVTWIAENMDMASNTCFVCNTINESSGPYKTGIVF